ncbi:MAG: tetratricopeptide repeat protein [Pirellulaceae bacterium]
MMTRQRKLKGRAAEDDRHAMTAGAVRRSRWPLIVTVIVTLTVAVVVGERLTRPRDDEGMSIGTDLRENRAESDRLGPLLTPPPARPAGLTTDGLIAEGTELADELCQSFPARPDVLAVSGRILFTLGRSTNAVARWEQALELSSHSGEAWLGMAEYAWEQGDFATAVERMRRLAEVDSERATQKAFILADSLLRLGEARQAIDTLKKVAQDTRLPPWAHVMLGQAHYQLKEYDQSLAAYREAVADEPATSAAHYGMSLALMRLERPEEAQVHRDEYARLKKLDMVEFDRAYGYGTHEERQSPAKLAPILASFYLMAGQFYAQAGQQDQAAMRWRRAWELTPDRPEPRQLLESLSVPPQ